jgi:thioredoxin reductase (NADPH)
VNHDVIIIGSGPAGMSAAISSAAEGYKTLVVESGVLGGQAFHSSRIENVFGYPGGVSGKVLMERSIEQAERLGVEFLQGTAVSLDEFGTRKVGVGVDCDVLFTKAAVIATGVQHRKLDAPGCVELEGKGVYYMTTPGNEEACTLRPAIVVGAGNSAGQAALHLARRSPKVIMVVRGRSIVDSMSAYLVERIAATPNIEVKYLASIQNCYDTGNSIGVQLLQNTRQFDINAGGVYVMIGATPQSFWTGLQTDSEGYLVAPEMQTSLPGVLAIGDVRYGSVKRVASAAGEGATVMRHVNRLVNPR